LRVSFVEVSSVCNEMFYNFSMSTTFIKQVPYSCRSNISCSNTILIYYNYIYFYACIRWLATTRLKLSIDSTAKLNHLTLVLESNAGTITRIGSVAPRLLSTGFILNGLACLLILGQCGSRVTPLVINSINYALWEDDSTSLRVILIVFESKRSLGISIKFRNVTLHSQ
jgi:hypothetical protein